MCAVVVVENVAIYCLNMSSARKCFLIVLTRDIVKCSGYQGVPVSFLQTHYTLYFDAQ